jgi:hypothetical protein
MNSLPSDVQDNLTIKSPLSVDSPEPLLASLKRRMRRILRDRQGQLLMLRFLVRIRSIRHQNISHFRVAMLASFV